MKLLILGGTSFVGRTLAATALRRGHDVTTFHRGLTGPDVAGVRSLRGDRSRDDGLDVLCSAPFDAAIDSSGLVPAHVLRTVRVLAGHVPFYAYVSSVSAYRDWERVPAVEDAALQDGDPAEDGDPADFSGYGRRKAGCELAVGIGYSGDSALVVRPGTIVGPYDNVGHLPWWLQRTARGGAAVAPANPARRVQLLDVRDLAAFVLDRVEAAAGGVFNLVPTVPTSIGAWLDACVAVTGAGTDLVWLPDEFLLGFGVTEWDELPLWLAETAPQRAVWAVVGRAAATAGLTCRTPAETLRDTWDWMRGGEAVRSMPGLPEIGLDPAKERSLLAAWRTRPNPPSTVERQG